MSKYDFSLRDSASLRRTIRRLEEYRDSLPKKSKEFVDRLLSVGIETAKANSGQYAGMIRFEKRLNMDVDGCEGVLIATDGQKIIREWYRNGEIISAEVSPVLMAEFGSGWLANVLDNVEGVGQGTFPEQRHAFDPEGWKWTTPDGVTHTSMGEAPTYPMHSAYNAVLFEVNRIAKEVFGNG